MKNIVILGGGSAGWLTALVMKSYFPKFNITLVQSEDIGIIGVGEATTPNLVELLNKLNINPYEVLRYTKGTLKNSIKFDNWNGDGKYYYHTFGEFNIANFYCEENGYPIDLHFYTKKLVSEKFSINEYKFSNTLCEEKKVNPLDCGWAIHFDATAFAKFLQSVGESREIKVIEGEYVRAEQDENGFIKKLILKNDISVDCDFVFDCTGFNRLLIGKLYNQKWNSYSKYLAMKKAIPFWLDTEEKINPYTDSIAMKYGWMWKIPLQHRTGSGYIFDSDYIDEQQALDEAEKYYGKKLEIRKIIPFDPGRFDNLWIKNCIAVGLSATFVEPIESTSLFFTINQLSALINFLDQIEYPNDHQIQYYNKIMLDEMENILNFVCLHYITKRNDTEFWKNLKQNYVLPEKLKTILDVTEKSKNLTLNQLINSPGRMNIFGIDSYLQVMYGLDLLPKDMKMGMIKHMRPTPYEYRSLIRESLYNNSIDHREFINYMNSGKFENLNSASIIKNWENRK